MVVFYNLENLFDTINDPDKLDEEFLPEGVKKWNSSKYYRKQSNMEKVFFDMAAINRQFPAVIGVSEIENRLVLEDLIAQPKMSAGNYRIVHYDSPDRRGVDCAFFYRPDKFQLEGSEAHRISFPGRPTFFTRDLVAMWGPGYSIPSEEGNEAIAMMMRLEGIVLDTCYTGKAFAGLVRRAREGFYKPTDNVLFIHTGGAGGLFAQDWESIE